MLPFTTLDRTSLSESVTPRTELVPGPISKRWSGSGRIIGNAPTPGPYGTGVLSSSKIRIGTHQMEEYIRANRPSDQTSDGRGLIRGMVITDRLRR